jgi:hypothetical protein
VTGFTLAFVVIDAACWWLNVLVEGVKFSHFGHVAHSLTGLAFGGKRISQGDIISKCRATYEGARQIDELLSSTPFLPHSLKSD